MTYKAILLMSFFPLALFGAKRVPYSIHYHSMHNNQFFHPQFGPPHSIHQPFGQPPFGSLQWHQQQNLLRYQQNAYGRKRKRAFARPLRDVGFDHPARAEIDEASRQRVPVIDERPFYDRNKKAILMGGGLIVGALIYYIMQTIKWTGKKKQEIKKSQSEIVHV